MLKEVDNAGETGNLLAAVKEGRVGESDSPELKVGSLRGVTEIDAHHGGGCLARRQQLWPSATATATKDQKQLKHKHRGALATLTITLAWSCSSFIFNVDIRTLCVSTFLITFRFTVGTAARWFA